MPHHYSFTGASSFAGINYYQLIYLIGDTTNDGIRSSILRKNKPVQLSVFPNSVHSELAVQLLGNSYLDMVIYSITGKNVLKKKIDRNANKITVDISILPSGTYIVTLDGKAGKAEGKCINQ